MTKLNWLPDPGTEPRSPVLQEDSLPAEPQGKPKDTGVHSLSLLQWIFLTQELNRGLLHCRQILYQLTNQVSPRIGIITSNNASRVLNYPPHSTDISEAKKLDNKAEVCQSVSFQS